MKTLVELFDKEPVENVYSSMAFNPDRVVYIGEKRLMTVEKQEHVRRFFRQKKAVDRAVLLSDSYRRYDAN